MCSRTNVLRTCQLSSPFTIPFCSISFLKSSAFIHSFAQNAILSSRKQV